MKCQNCGKRLRKTESFCTNCGFYNEPKKLSLEDDALGQLDYFKDPDEPEEEVELLDEIEEDDEESYKDFIEEDYDASSLVESKDEYVNKDYNFDHYVEAYIGEDYKLIVKRPINIYALLLSWMYFLYRKMYLIGIVGLVITGLFIKYLMPMLPYYIAVVMILSGLVFNPIYLLVVKGKVQRLLDNHDYFSDQEKEDLCAKKGGVNTPVALLIFCIFLGIMFLNYVKLDFGSAKPKFWKENNENQANCILMTKNAFQLIEKEALFGVFDEAICHVKITQTKNYDIYIKIKEDTNYQYYYFNNNGKYLSLEGDTSKIERLEKEKKNNTILEDEEKLLEKSKDLPNLFDTMIRQAQDEENLVRTGRNNSQRIYFHFSKDEIYK